MNDITRFMFVIIVVLIWCGLNSYVFIRAWQSLSLPGQFKIPYIIITILLALSLPFVMIFRENFSPEWSGVLQNIGGTWMLILAYAAMACLLFDIIRGIEHLKPFFPEIITRHYITVKRMCFALTAIGIGITLFWGNYTFRNPKITHLELTTHKSLGEREELKILFFSDLHLGSLVKTKQLQKYVGIMEQEDFDMLLIGGDFIDGDQKIWEKRGFAAILGELKPKMGTYVALGNHEYYSGLKESIALIKKMGFIPLVDSCAYPASDESIVVIGRDDRTNPYRSSVGQLLDTQPLDAYRIVIDHQPAEIAQVESARADLLLSGHTHNGQVFPLTCLIRLMWQVAYGYERIGETDVYVSSGLGLWGPQFRIGSHSEIVHIMVRTGQ